MEDRREDWNNSVEKRLVDLNSAQLSLDTEQIKLRRRTELHDAILRGDMTRNKEGLIEAVHALSNEINKFNRIFDKDYLGHGGLISFITFVYEREKERQDAARESRGYKWAFWGVILAAFIGAAAVILTNRDQIAKWWDQPPASPLDRTIEKARHPKGRKIVRVRVIHEEAPDDDSSNQVP